MTVLCSSANMCPAALRNEKYHIVLDSLGDISCNKLGGVLRVFFYCAGSFKR